MENIRAESRRMKKLVEEMLTLFRAESVRRETAFSEVDLSDVVTDAALRFEPVAFEAGHTLSYDIAPDLTVRGDGGTRFVQLYPVTMCPSITISENGKL